MQAVLNYRWNIFAVLILVVSFLAIRQGLALDLAEGGNDWRQGDWLISFAAGLVRRGVSGELMDWLGGMTGGGILGATVMVQYSLYAAMLLCLLAICGRMRFGPLECFLLASPVGFQFWAIDYSGSGRKEIVAILAFLLLAATAGTPMVLRRVVAVLASVLFVLGVLLHEGLFFALPAYLVVLYAALQEQGRAVFRRHFVAVGGASVLLLGFHFLFSRLEDISPICQELIAAGLNETICGGAIASLAAEASIKDMVATNIWRLVYPNGLYLLIDALVFFVLPLALLRRRGEGAMPVLVPLAILLSFAPLYAVAIDWGRWINFGYMAALALVMIRRIGAPWPEAPVLGARVPMPALVAVVIVLFAGLHHDTAEPFLRLCSVLQPLLDCPDLAPLSALTAN